VIVNDYVLRELNRQRRAQVADNIAAALRATKDRWQPRLSVLGRRTRTAPTTQPVTTAVAFRTGAAAH
jgi:hypothetical protein